MRFVGRLQMDTPTPCEIMTRPELLQQWFFGPPGWPLVVCDIDLRVGLRLPPSGENQALGRMAAAWFQHPVEELGVLSGPHLAGG